MSSNLDEQQNSPAFNLQQYNIRASTTPTKEKQASSTGQPLGDLDKTTSTTLVQQQPSTAITPAVSLPEQYKNVGFAKSVREKFAEKESLPNNPVDYVDQILNKPHNENHQTNQQRKDEDKKAHRDLTIQKFVSYKKGLRVTCDICLETFADRKSMLRHKVFKHDKFSPHQCTVCHKTFYKPGDTRRHMFTHSDVRQFACKYCGLTYKTKPNLQRHWRLKHPEHKTLDVNKAPTYLGGLTQSTISSNDNNHKGDGQHLVAHEFQTTTEHHHQSSSSILGQSIKHSLNHPSSDEEILQTVPFLPNTDHFIGRPENIQIQSLMERRLFW